MAKEITTQDFDQIVAQAKPVLIDFYADWCGPCQILSPIVEEVGSQMAEIDVVKLNVDNNFSLAERHGVLSIPTLVIFKEGKELARKTGALSKDALVAWIKEKV